MIAQDSVVMPTSQGGSTVPILPPNLEPLPTLDIPASMQPSTPIDMSPETKTPTTWGQPAVLEVTPNATANSTLQTANGNLDLAQAVAMIPLEPQVPVPPKKKGPLGNLIMPNIPKGTPGTTQKPTHTRLMVEIFAFIILILIASNIVLYVMLRAEMQKNQDYANLKEYINTLPKTGTTQGGNTNPSGITPSGVPQAVPTVIINEQKNFTSADLDISITVPVGVEIREVEKKFSADGPACEEGKTYPTYKAVEAWMDSTKILTLGTSERCTEDPNADEQDVTVAFERWVEGRNYRLLKNHVANISFMRLNVVFGKNSKIADGKAKTNDAIIDSNADYTNDMFAAAASIIASIKPL